nr:ROK family protein [Nakamurella flavida]
MLEELVVETGPREETRPGKPATLIELNRTLFQIVGVDLSDADTFTGGLLDLDGTILDREEIALDGGTGERALDLVLQLCERLVARASAPLLGIGVGSPGIVDSQGNVETAPNLGWTDLPLRTLLAERFDLPVIVSNDADAALLAEFSFGDTDNDMMLVKAGRGVGASLLLGGAPLVGTMNAAGEIGHVVAGSAGAPCVCGKNGCLETWVAVPRLTAAFEHRGLDWRTADGLSAGHDILAEAGRRLGLVLAPVVAALNLTDVIVSGPERLLSGAFVDAAVETVQLRTMRTYTGDLTMRMTTLGEDIVTRGAAMTVVSRVLGFS